MLRLTTVDHPRYQVNPVLVGALPVTTDAPIYQFEAVCGTTSTLTTGLNYMVVLVAFAT